MPRVLHIPDPFECSDICSGCGMCCNGVMFHTVELQSSDSPKAIAALGLKLKRKAGKIFIQQPCPAFKHSCCSIYSQRPERCQAFECRQLTGVKAGTIPITDALERIRAATALVDRINGPDGLFELLGEPNTWKPRAKRFNNLVADFADLPDLEAAKKSELQAELVETNERLEALLDAHFRVRRVDIERD